MSNGTPSPYAAPDPPAAARKGMPLIVKIIIGAAILLPLLGIGAAIVIPGLQRARIAGNEASAIGTMRAISSAQVTFASSCGHGLFARSLPVLGRGPIDGSGSAYVSVDLAIGERIEKSGYVCWIEAPAAPAGADTPCNGAGPEDVSMSFVAKAEPANPSAGGRFFATTGDGIVYQSEQPITFGADGSANQPAVPVQ